MLRVVAFRKAILAGAAGALAWEIALRLLALAGFPAFDLVRALGTLPLGERSAFVWWPLGMTAHALVGAAWALFYAYFFWARFRWRPALQGLAFAALPAVLAIVVVVPQLRLMHLDAEVARIGWPFFLFAFAPATLASLLIGHALFGLTIGALYTRPVGYSAAEPRVKAPRPARPPKRQAEQARKAGGFIFATGLECSYPTTEQGRWRRDQMAGTGHYRRWQDDFGLARELGITHIRYGPPLHLIFTAPGRYDWSWCDEPMREMRELGPEPIVDLCHFGVPAWLENFQNPEMVPALAEYASAFADRFPWVRFYTPVNEMYVCARMSALQGLWNEQRSDERAFVRAALNLATASVEMTDAILARRADTVFINSESSEFYQPCCPDEGVRKAAELENERRFLPLDLIYGHELSPGMRDHLHEQGFDGGAYARFKGREVPRRSILGLDYYEWNEKLVDLDGRSQALGELFGWYVIASQYWERYRRTMMHTETNRSDAADAPRWLWRQWHNVQLLRGAGVPIVGFTWYSLTDQIDWDRAIAQPLGIVDPVGLVDLNRDPRPVGLSYKHLIDMHRDEPEYRDCKALQEVLA